MYLTWAIMWRRLLRVCKNKNILLKGFRNLQDGLWDITLLQPVSTRKCRALLFKSNQFRSQKLNNLKIQDVVPTINSNLNIVIHKQTTKNELAKFIHAACFSPAQSTFIQMINNDNFISWWGSSSSLINKIPPSINTAKGHLNQEKNNIQSTKIPAAFLYNL